MIDEKKLIKALERHYILTESWQTGFAAGRVRKYYDFVIETINSQPPADVPDTKDGEWIPCSERLPKESDYYMACIYDSEVDGYDFRKTWFAHVDDYDMEESEWRELYDYETVTAWKPLPEPYKGE